MGRLYMQLDLRLPLLNLFQKIYFDCINKLIPFIWLLYLAVCCYFCVILPMLISIYFWNIIFLILGSSISSTVDISSDIPWFALPTPSFPQYLVPSTVPSTSLAVPSDEQLLSLVTSAPTRTYYFSTFLLLFNKVNKFTVYFQ